MGLGMGLRLGLGRGRAGVGAGRVRFRVENTLSMCQRIFGRRWSAICLGVRVRVRVGKLELGIKARVSVNT